MCASGLLSRVAVLAVCLLSLEVSCQLFCTADVKQCTDGSYVSRDPENNCRFRPCPDVGCPDDTQLCPDGSSVSREPANGCAFARCPDVDDEIVCAADVFTCADGTTVSRDPSAGCTFTCPEDRVDPADACGEGEEYDDVAGHCTAISCDSETACASPTAICIPEARTCFRSPCPQFRCEDATPTCPRGEEMDTATGECTPVSCDAENACPFGEACVPQAIMCIRAPCPQFSCERRGCPEDARLCSDGSTVVRDPALDCDFPACPNIDCRAVSCMVCPPGFRMQPTVDDCCACRKDCSNVRCAACPAGTMPDPDPSASCCACIAERGDANDGADAENTLTAWLITLRLKNLDRVWVEGNLDTFEAALIKDYLRTSGGSASSVEMVSMAWEGNARRRRLLQSAIAGVQLEVRSPVAPPTLLAGNMEPLTSLNSLGGAKADPAQAISLASEPVYHWMLESTNEEAAGSPASTPFTGAASRRVPHTPGALLSPLVIVAGCVAFVAFRV